MDKQAFKQPLIAVGLLALVGAVGVPKPITPS
jgi:hypothetical protein